MANNASAVDFQSNGAGWVSLASHIMEWKKSKVSAEQLGLNWAFLQGKFYGGERSVKYVTLNSIIACNRGSFFSRIKMPVDHGVETKDTHLPILTVEDFSNQNIPSFGDCTLKVGETSTICIPRITSAWNQGNVTASAELASLLKADAYAVCNIGGIICIKEVNPTPQESLMAVLREQYGFDERTTKIVLKLYQAIQDVYSREKQIKRDWRFTRFLGGLVYALIDKDGGIEVAKWEQTAGKLTDVSLKKYMTKTLGLIGDDYEYIQYKVRIQHFLADKHANSTKYSANARHGDLPPLYISNMNAGLNKTVGSVEFVTNWNQQCDDMCGMTDFAHQQITTATILATKVEKDGVFANIATGGPREREQMAGWLGDATIYGSKGDSPTFGDDDYKADLDAENIGYMVGSEGYAYIMAVEDYYEKRLLEDNRATIFLENNSLNEVKELIYDKLVSHEFVKRNKVSKKELKNKYLLNNESNWIELIRINVHDTYNFIRSLDPPLSDMGVF